MQMRLLFSTFRVPGAITPVAWGAFLLMTSVSGVAQDPPDTDPQVSLTANGTRVAEVFRGMPLMLTAAFVHPEPFASGVPAVVLAAATPPWTNAVTITVSDSNGAVQSWPWQSVDGADSTVSLTESTYAELVWWLAPAQTLALPPGTYTVQLTLDTISSADPQAWKGRVDSVPVEIAIRDEPVPLSEIQAIDKFVQLALFAGRQDTTESALNHVQALLTSYPTNIAGLMLKTSILKSMGRVTDALAASQDALLQVHALHPNAQEPPEFLLGLNADLREIAFTLPRLSISRSGPQFTISWIGVAGTDYTLQRSFDLQSWIDLATDFEVTGNTFRWTTTLTEAPQYFRVSF